MKLVQRSELARRLGVSPAAISKLAERTPDFPRPVKFGAQQQARVFFDDEAVTAWLEQRSGRATH